VKRNQWKGRERGERANKTSVVEKKKLLESGGQRITQFDNVILARNEKMTVLWGRSSKWARLKWEGEKIEV